MTSPLAHYHYSIYYYKHNRLARKKELYPRVPAIGYRSASDLLQSGGVVHFILGYDLILHGRLELYACISPIDSIKG